MTTWDGAKVLEAIRPHVLPAHVGILEAVAPVLARLLNHEVTVSDAEQALAAAQPMFADLAGRRVRADRAGAVIDFGSSVAIGAQFQDVAGGDIVKVTINLNGQMFVIGEQTQFHDTEHDVVQLIRRVDPTILDLVARDLGLEPQKTGISPPWAIARTLIRSKFDVLDRVVGAIAISMCTEVGDLVDVVSPFCWVPADAAAQVPPVRARPRGRRSLGLNATNTDTGEAFVSCAPMPRDYIVLSIEGGWGEDYVQHVQQRIDGYLLEKEWCLPGVECAKELAAAGTAVFVVIPPPAPTPKQLADIRGLYPDVTFVLLAGDVDELTFADYQLPDVTFLTPPLKRDDEVLAVRKAFNTKRIGRVKCQRTS